MKHRGPAHTLREAAEAGVQQQQQRPPAGHAFNGISYAIAAVLLVAGSLAVIVDLLRRLWLSDTQTNLKPAGETSEYDDEFRRCHESSECTRDNEVCYAGFCMDRGWLEQEVQQSSPKPAAGAETMNVDRIMQDISDEIQPLAQLEDSEGHIAAALRQVDNIYKDELATKARVGNARNEAKEEVRRVHGDDHAATYGEILPSTIAAILQRLGANAGQRYYDLGSGTGKTNLIAWLLGLDATGIELVSRRWEVACEALERLKGVELPQGQQGNAEGGLRFIHGSLFDVDFSDADIVVINSVSFTDDMMSKIAVAARSMRAGTHIVTAKYKPLPGNEFEVVDKFLGPSSWASDAKWIVQRVQSTSSNEGAAQSKNDVRSWSTAAGTMPSCSL
eukprot:TRINITY_DN81575_c0_g1_i1.p1 TRINITY_DN81575_c0_g1~~TRINITY_DN81575_c0_g1_i1.p1  ORF type:complete len:390 (+),score=71.98 TRINITY_DN81575_c0_g1_i1:80-1249(+)